MMGDKTKKLFKNGFLGFLENHCRLAGSERDRFLELADQLLEGLEQGHTCLSLIPGDEEILHRSHLVSRGEDAPLVVHRGRLYLHRYFSYEYRLARQLAALCRPGRQLIVADDIFSHYFPPDENGQKEDLQAAAARLALRRKLALICGGPGTGKTSTVAKILALMLHADISLRIGLAAPTGKAAQRLSASIGASLEKLVIPEEIDARIPEQAMTLHRLLGVRRHSTRCLHNHQHPLAFDVVLIDEASMIDLAMLSKLVDAIPAGGRLILLGDRDQLASVESGAGLGELTHILTHNSVELQRTYRFDHQIKKLATRVNSGDADRAWEILVDQRVENISVEDELPLHYIARSYEKMVHKVVSAGEQGLAEIFTTMSGFMVLTAVRAGRRGVEYLNREIELFLRRQGMDCIPGGWYQGRPVMVTSNDYNLGLYNGDIGICLPTEGRHKLKVWFNRPDGRMQGFPPSLLPPVQTAFALTVHKSQGSEFDEIVVVLPEEENRILSRELIYTAITRAKSRVLLVADREILVHSLGRRVERRSGLAEELAACIGHAEQPV